MTNDIELSLNEVEILAMKAARGAGFAWGEAEETGKAARWLARAGFPWAISLSRLLAGDQDHGVALIREGCRIADDPRALGSSASLTAGHVEWLLPFADAAALSAGVAVVIKAVGVPVAGVDGMRLYVRGPQLDLAFSDLAADCPLCLEAVPTCQGFPCAVGRGLTRSIIDRGDMACLNVLAARTYVPASARSRALGAGGLDDDA